METHDIKAMTDAEIRAVVAEWRKFAEMRLMPGDEWVPQELQLGILDLARYVEALLDHIESERGCL